MTLILGADHRGYTLKEEVKPSLEQSIVDCSSPQYDEEDNYPDIAQKVANQLSGNDNKAILFCGSGHGMDIAANRFPYIRAILGFNSKVVAQGREHEDANVLVLAADWTSVTEAIERIHIFLNTPASDDVRHIQRRQKLSSILT